MSAFTEAIELNLKGCEAVSTGSCPGCTTCELADEPTEHELSLANEPHFSWHACECCRSHLGGDRYPAHYIIPDATSGQAGQPIHHMNVCADCMLYLANGDEPESWEG